MLDLCSSLVLRIRLRRLDLFGPGTYSPNFPTHKIGIRQGLLLAVTSVGALTTSPIGEAIVSQENGSFTGVKVFAGVLFCRINFCPLSKMFGRRPQPHEEGLGIKGRLTY